MEFLKKIRLKEVSERVNRLGISSPPALTALKVSVRKIVFGPNHIALLLEDGQICRIAFSIISDRLDLSRQDSSKT